MLCLMRYEDWTFREAEVRLSEHVELRSALRLRTVPDYTTLYRFLLRFEKEDVARVMNEIVRRMPRRWRSPATVAVDATGLAPARSAATSSAAWNTSGTSRAPGNTG
ncbi:MAG: transposase [Acidobacteriaceae bacterium]